jgi:serine/threonine protein kinase
VKIDFYSFGIVAYQVLTGLPDFYEGIEFKDLRLRVMKGLRPDSYTNKREEIIQRYPKHTDAPSVLVDMVQRCWSVEPAQRPPF